MFDPDIAYAVVSMLPIAGGLPCPTYVMAHELAHLMGSNFSTIMSTINPVILKFSNPAISCNGFPCGISEIDDPVLAANNALSLNNTRACVAKYRPVTAIVKGDFNCDGVVDAADVSRVERRAVGIFGNIVEEAPNAVELAHGDINGDGVIDHADLTRIQRKALGLETF